MVYSCQAEAGALRRQAGAQKGTRPLPPGYGVMVNLHLLAFVADMSALIEVAMGSIVAFQALQ